LATPQKGKAFNDNNIAFLLARNGINIELIDTNEKAELIKLVPNHLAATANPEVSD
jgi:methylmalonyl-CoA/ethylmalonyl-CoA epimerase